MAALPKAEAGFSRMRSEEFLAWSGDGTGRRFQLVDGEIRAMAPASITHGTIQANFTALLRSHLRGTGCRVVVEPGIAPRFRADFNVRVPDLAVSCVADTPGAQTLEDPVLLVEILSPGNEPETRENVWAYTTIPSVREILLIRSTAIAAELLRRDEDGNWPAATEILELSSTVTLAAVGFSCPLAALFEDTHLARAAI